MSTLTNKTLLLCVGLTWLLASGCSGSSGFAGGSKKNSDQKPSNDGGDSQDDENTHSDTPAQVSGAFLTADLKCSYLDLGTSLMLDDTLGQMGTATTSTSTGDTTDMTGGLKTVADTMPIGCGIYNHDSGEKLDLTGTNPKLELLDENDQTIPMDTVAAPAGTEYHELANLPNAYKTSGTLKMSLTQAGNPRTYKLPTKDVSDGSTDGAGLGNGKIGHALPPNVAAVTSTATPSVTTAPPKIPSSLTADAVWHGNDAGWFLGGINTGDFCDGSGPRSEMSQSGQDAVAAANVLGSFVNITVKVPPTFSGPSPIKEPCFQSVCSPGGKNCSIVKEGNGCLFLKYGYQLFMINEAKLQQAGYNATGVAAYAQSVGICAN